MKVFLLAFAVLCISIFGAVNIDRYCEEKEGKVKVLVIAFICIIMNAACMYSFLVTL